MQLYKLLHHAIYLAILRYTKSPNLFPNNFWPYSMYNTVRRKIFATEKFRESLPKRGGRNIRDKNIREGGSDTLRNTITWLLCLCGSSDLRRSMNPSQYYSPSRVYSACLNNNRVNIATAWLRARATAILACCHIHTLQLGKGDYNCERSPYCFHLQMYR